VTAQSTLARLRDSLRAFGFGIWDRASSVVYSALTCFRRLIRALAFGAWGIAWVAVLGGWLIRGWSTADLAWASYLYYLPGFAFLPLSGLLAILQLRLFPRRRWGPLLGALLLLNVGPLMGLALSGAHKTRGQLRVVTANVQSYTADLDYVGQSLARLEADVVLLQEVWTLRHLAVLQKHLPDFRFVQAGELLDPDSDYPEIGVFIGSKLPAQGRVTLNHALQLDLQAPFGPVRVIAVHGRKRFEFSPGDVTATVKMQTKQALNIQSALAGRFTVVGGDFNAPPTAPGPKILRASLADSFSNAGLGYGLTFPAKMPVLRIDQILHGSGFQAVACRTAWTGSDHLAVVADLAVVP
jgi:vancomycin resistance protein VanJ